MQNPSPIFLAGPMRSGTTLIRWILDTHPSIVCRSEQNYLKPFVVAFRNAFLQMPIGDEYDETKMRELEANHGIACARQTLSARFRAFHESFFLECAENANKRRWADASHWVLDKYIASIDLLYDHTPRYVILVRNGMDCAVSALEKFRNMSFERYFQYWASVVDLHRSFSELNGDRCHYVRYEDLVAAPEIGISAMFEFLGESPLAVESVEHSVFGTDHGPRFGDHKIIGTTKFSTESIGRWHSVPPALYREALRNCPEFNATMIRCGYEPVTA